MKILNAFKLLTIFETKAPLQMFDWYVGVWLRVWNIELTYVPSLQINQRKYSAEKYVWHLFWKSKRSWWDSKQNECLRTGSHRKGSFKKKLWKISQNSQENICARMLLLIEINSADLQLHWKHSLAQVFSCNVCEICRNTFFAEHDREAASDYGSINSNVGRIGKRNSKWYKN